MRIEPGHVLHERWRIEQALGEGGMGYVMAGRDLLLERRVAIKSLHPHLAAIEEIYARFLTEARILARIDAPQVVRIHDAFDWNGLPVVVMEYIEGEPLSSFLEHTPRPPDAFVRVVASEMLHGLAAAHDQGVVHRDVKPDNIMIVSRKQGDVGIRLLDFGVAQVEQDHRHTRTGTALGTVRYMSPEQVRDASRVDRRSDLFGAGLVVWEMLSGEQPWVDAEDDFGLRSAVVYSALPALPLSVSPDLHALVDALTQKDPAHRPESAAAALTLLGDVRVDGPAAVPRAAESPAAPAAPTAPAAGESGTPEQPATRPDASGEVRAEDVSQAAQDLGKSLGGVARVLYGMARPVVQSGWSTVRKRVRPDKEAGSESEGEGAPPRAPVLAYWRLHVLGLGLVAAIVLAVPLLLAWQQERQFAPPPPVAASVIEEAIAEAESRYWRRSMTGELVLVRAGTFTMGSPETERGRRADENQVEVTISRPFYLGRYPVLQQQYSTVMRENPAGFATCGRRCPVERVSWLDAVRFTNQLNQNLSLPPCYSDDGIVIGGETVVDCEGYRLPTEAEWEYAARAGSRVERYGITSEIAWYASNSEGRTHPIARKAPNHWGFHDMLGNVWEWTSDHYADHLVGGVDPVGPAEGSGRVIRGGSWDSEPAFVRAAYRLGVSTVDRSPTDGFRIARTAH